MIHLHGYKHFRKEMKNLSVCKIFVAPFYIIQPTHATTPALNLKCGNERKQQLIGVNNVRVCAVITSGNIFKLIVLEYALNHLIAWLIIDLGTSFSTRLLQMVQYIIRLWFILAYNYMTWYLMFITFNSINDFKTVRHKFNQKYFMQNYTYSRQTYLET